MPLNEASYRCAFCLLNGFDEVAETLFMGTSVCRACLGDVISGPGMAAQPVMRHRRQHVPTQHQVPEGTLPPRPPRPPRP